GCRLSRLERHVSGWHAARHDCRRKLARRGSATVRIARLERPGARGVGTEPKNSICFFFAPVLLCSSRFQQVLGVTPCPQTETCHPEDLRLVPKEVGGM